MLNIKLSGSEAVRDRAQGRLEHEIARGPGQAPGAVASSKTGTPEADDQWL